MYIIVTVIHTAGELLMKIPVIFVIIFFLVIFPVFVQVKPVEATPSGGKVHIQQIVDLRSPEKTGSPAASVFSVRQSERIVLPGEDISIDITVENRMSQNMNYTVMLWCESDGLYVEGNTEEGGGIMMTKELYPGEEYTYDTWVRSFLIQSYVSAIYRYNVSLFIDWVPETLTGTQIGETQWHEVMIVQSFDTLEQYLVRTRGSITNEYSLDQYAITAQALGQQHDLDLNVTNTYSETYIFHLQNDWSTDVVNFTLAPGETENIHRSLYPGISNNMVGGVNKFTMWLEACPEQFYPDRVWLIGTTTIGIPIVIGYDQPLTVNESDCDFEIVEDQVKINIQYTAETSFDLFDVSSASSSATWEDLIKGTIEVAQSRIEFWATNEIGGVIFSANPKVFVFVVGADVALSLFLEDIPQRAVELIPGFNEPVVVLALVSLVISARSKKRSD